MKRQIEFRGKTKSGKWIYGMPTFEFDYIFNGDGYDSVDNYEVDHKTVGQFTGLTDKNGVKIFEGDIVMSYDCGEPLGTNIIFWDEQRCGWSDKRDDGDSQTNYDGFDFVIDCKVIGNIHDNPELI